MNAEGSASGSFLNVLLLDSARGCAEPWVRALAAVDADLRLEFADTPDALRAMLQRGRWDLVLAFEQADRLPLADVVEIARDLDAELPVVAVLDQPSLARAVAAMRAGAADVLRSDEPEQIGEVIRRTLSDPTSHQRRLLQARQLAESERTFRNLAETSLQGVLVHRDERPLFANRAFAQMLGYDGPERLLALPSVAVLAAPDERERLLGYLHDRIAGRPAPSRYEYRALHLDGHEVWLDASVSVVQWQGAPAVQIAVIDVTGAKRTLQELERHEALLHAVLETLPHRLVVKDLQSRYVLVNREFAVAAGMPREQIVGRTLNELSGRSLVPMDAALAGDRAVLHEGVERLERIEPIQVGDGVGYVRNIKTPLRDPQGRVWGLVSLSEDVTAQQRLAEQSARDRSLLIDIIESSPAAILYLDAERRVEVWNHKVLELFPDLLPVLRQGLSFEALVRMEAKSLDPDPKAMEAHVKKRMALFDASPPEGFEMAIGGGRTLLVQDRRSLSGGYVLMAMDISERKRAAEALVASEANYRLLSEQAGDGVFIGDTTGRFLHVNPRLCEVTGYSEAELLSMRFPDLADPQSLRVSPIRLKELLAGETTLTERPLRRKDGTTFIAETSARLRVDGKVQGILRDITPRRRAEAALRDSQRLLQAVFETVPIFFYVKDAEGRYVMMNQRFADGFGIPMEKFIGKKAEEVTQRPKSETRTAFEQDQLVLSGAVPQVDELLSRVLADGQPHTMRIIKAPLKREDGRIYGLVGIAEDVTEKVRGESELRASQRLLKAVFDTIPHYLFVKDAFGHYLMANERFELAWGLNPGDIQAQQPDVLPSLSAAQRQRNSEDDRLVLNGKLPRLEEIREMRFGEGPLRTLRTLKTALRDEAGSIYGLVGMAEDVTELERAQRELRESQRLLQAVFDTIPQLVFVKDAQARYLIVNRQFSETVAALPKELVGKLTTDVPMGTDAEREKSHDIDWQILRGEIPRSDSVRPFEFADGKARLMRTIKAPLKDGAGRIYGLVGVAEDVTAQLAAHAEAAAAHARLADAIKHLNGGFLLFDHDERLLLWNDALLQLFPSIRSFIRAGIRFEEILRASIADLDVPEAEREAQVQRRLGEFRDPPGFTIEQHLKDGRWLLVRDRRTAEGGTVCLRMDITEQKVAEHTLREGEARFRRLTENAPDVIFRYRLRPDHAFEYVSPVVAAITGYTPDEHYADPQLWMRISHPDDVAQQAGLFEIGSESAGALVSVRWKYKEGDWIWIEERCTPIFDDSGQLLGIEGIVRDISTRKELEEKLLRSQRMEAVGRLAGGIAHDFNNQLSVMGSYSTFVLEQLPEGHPARDDVQVIQRTVERSAALTRQLLAFSRKQLLQLEVVNLNALVAQLEKILRRVIGEDVILVTHKAPELDAVTADPSQIEQILMNLAVNARDAMPTGGMLTIETTNAQVEEHSPTRPAELPPGFYVQLSVSDTGVGMTPEVRRHLFEPFFTTKDIGKGTGLGLATVYGIVRQLGGDITVRSEPEQGATFTIYLPPTDAAKVPDTAAAAESARREVGSERILLVEDEELVRAAARRTLEGHGYRVRAAANALAALEIHAEAGEPFDLLLTDVVMPEVSGPQLAERLLQRQPGLLVLFMTGYAEGNIAEHLKQSDQHDILQKPISPDALLKKVRAALSRPSGDGHTAVGAASLSPPTSHSS